MGPIYSQRNSDEGQANLFLLVGLTLALISMMMLFVRIGNANDLRTEAQTAADAAALAAAGVARDSAAERLADGEMPYSRLYDPAKGRAVAEDYAQENGAALESIRASDDGQGNLGNIVRVEVHSTNCQAELEQDRSRAWEDLRCDKSDDETNHVGNAAATAEVSIPDCSYTFNAQSVVGIACGGEPVQSYQHARRIIDVDLVDSEGQYIYKPLGSTPGDSA